MNDGSTKVEALQEQGHVEVHPAQDSAIITQFLSWNIVDDVQRMQPNVKAVSGQRTFTAHVNMNHPRANNSICSWLFLGCGDLRKSRGPTEK